MGAGRVVTRTSTVTVARRWYSSGSCYHKRYIHSFNFPRKLSRREILLPVAVQLALHSLQELRAAQLRVPPHPALPRDRHELLPRRRAHLEPRVPRLHLRRLIPPLQLQPLRLVLALRVQQRSQLAFLHLALEPRRVHTRGAQRAAQLLHGEYFRDLGGRLETRDRRDARDGAAGERVRPARPRVFVPGDVCFVVGCPGQHVPQRVPATLARRLLLLLLGELKLTRTFHGIAHGPGLGGVELAGPPPLLRRRALLRDLRLEYPRLSS
mmetsp:Transcript_3557/g.16220  ORF Transcript_3557/g.16220 Transcript_3557/m.16220 type:complete len:267 (-) Transcript_3557:635-1435(-)